LVDALADAHLRAERFRAGTGIWPYETPAEWYAAAVELFGVAILERPLAQVQLLVEGELTRRRSAAAAADAEPQQEPSEAEQGKRRGRLPGTEAKAKQVLLLAKLRDHPTMVDSPAEAAAIVGVSEATARRWIREFQAANKRRN
jgi:hypothetical protein